MSNFYEYNNVEWTTVEKVNSNSHIHVHNQQFFDDFYALGVRHFPASNYYPSAPMYPAATIHEKHWHPGQDFGVVLSGVYQPPPIDWNAIVNVWAAGLPPATQALLPLGQGPLRLTTIPGDVLFSPNAEHHGFTNGGFHLNAIGSFWSSGHFDAADQFEITTNGYNDGTGITWEASIDSMLVNLQFSDGGGVTINHPDAVPLVTIYSMLDHDERVLGIEVINEFFERSTGTGIVEDKWDDILTTGRKCLGFFVYDHYDASLVGAGVTGNILLLDVFTEQNALTAYRRGTFYGAYEAINFEFNELSELANVITATVNKPANFTFISDDVIVKTENGVTTSTYDMTTVIGAGNSYVRVKVEDPAGGFLYSQPFYLD